MSIFCINTFILLVFTLKVIYNLVTRTVNYMKNKKITIIIIAISILVCASIFFLLFYTNKEKSNDNNSINATYISKEDFNTNLENITDNNHVIKTNSKSTIRNISFFDKTMFEGKKSILLMWGSWCPNCAKEFDDLEEILEFYKDTDINIQFIAHDFELNTLVDFLEREDIDYDTQVFLDLKRVIRGAIDPEASTVPVTYFLDENVNIKYKHNEVITLEKVKEIVKDLGW